MPIQPSEIVVRRSALISDTTPAQNGGEMGAIVPSGVKNNVFPDVSNAQRQEGDDRWRKVWVHLNSVEDVALKNVKIFVTTQVGVNLPPLQGEGWGGDGVLRGILPPIPLPASPLKGEESCVPTGPE